MKNILALCILFVVTTNVKATNGSFLGGEFYWECDQYAQYQLYLNLYYECGAVNIPTFRDLKMSSTLTIRLSRISMDTISSDCNYFTNGCSGNESYTYIKVTYKQGTPIEFSSYPNMQSYIFTTDGCCIDTTFENLAISTPETFQITAIIYSVMYNGLNLRQWICLSSSPKFNSPPVIFANGNIKNLFSPQSSIENGDSLYHRLQPIYGGGSFTRGQAIPWKSGFSSNAPITGMITGSNFFPQHGDIFRYDSIASGKFMCNMLVETWRKDMSGIPRKFVDLNRVVTVIFNDTVNNSPPSVSVTSLSGFSPVTQSSANPNLWEIQINEGDTFGFKITAIDTDLNQNYTLQQISIEPSHGNFGIPIDSSGCPLGSPCSKMISNNPNGLFTNMISNEISVFGKHQCGHFSKHFFREYKSRKTFYYHFLAKDDNCPSNGVQPFSVLVYVNANPEPTYPEINKNVEHLENGIVNFTWSEPNDTLRGFKYYLIHKQSMFAFRIVDTIYDFNTTHYTDTIEPWKNIRYKISMETRCGSFINLSESAAGIWLGIDSERINPTTIEIKLYWSEQFQNETSLYEVWRKIGNNQWQFIALTSNLHYVDYQSKSGMVNSQYQIRVDGTVISNTVKGWEKIGHSESNLPPTYVYYENSGLAVLNVGPKWHHKPVKLTLTDLSGKAVYIEDISSTPDNTKFELPNNLIQGIYILQMHSGKEFAVFKVKI